MKKNGSEVWRLVMEWLKRLLRSPFSNFATRFTLILGGSVLATPLVEHLIFNALLKKVFDIDLGINVPDFETFFFGTVLVALALTHNLVFIALNQNHQRSIQNNRATFYQELWGLMDTMVDDTARLLGLYGTVASNDDFELADKAEQSYIALLTFARKSRPFFLTERLYKECSSIAHSCKEEVSAFRGCAREKRNDDTNYLFADAMKITQANIREIAGRYNALGIDIRNEVERTY